MYYSKGCLHISKLYEQELSLQSFTGGDYTVQTFFSLLDLTYLSSSFQYSHSHFTAKEKSSSFQTFLHSSHSFLVMQSKSVTAIILFFRGGPDWLYSLCTIPMWIQGHLQFLKKIRNCHTTPIICFYQKKKNSDHMTCMDALVLVRWKYSHGCSTLGSNGSNWNQSVGSMADPGFLFDGVSHPLNPIRE